MPLAFKNFFTLLLMALLLAGFLLFWDAKPEYFLRDKKGDNFSLEAEVPKADSYMIDIRSRKFSVEGNLDFILSSQQSLYFKKGNYFELTAPHLVAFSKDTADRPWEATAEEGTIYSNAGKVLLNGDVDMWQKVRAGQFNRLTTSRLTLWPQKKLAQSRTWVEISTPNGVTKGKGMDANLAKETFSLHSNVKGVHFAL